MSESPDTEVAKKIRDVIDRAPSLNVRVPGQWIESSRDVVPAPSSKGHLCYEPGDTVVHRIRIPWLPKYFAIRSAVRLGRLIDSDELGEKASQIVEVVSIDPDPDGYVVAVSEGADPFICWICWCNIPEDRLHAFDSVPMFFTCSDTCDEWLYASLMDRLGGSAIHEPGGGVPSVYHEVMGKAAP